MKPPSTKEKPKEKVTHGNHYTTRSDWNSTCPRSLQTFCSRCLCQSTFCSLQVSTSAVSDAITEGEYFQKRDELMDAMHSPTPKGFEWSKEEDTAQVKVAAMWKEIVTLPEFKANPWDQQYFFDVKDRVVNTRLFSTLKAMPKGSILHVHPTAMGSYEELVNDAATTARTDDKQWYVAAPGTSKDYFLLKSQNQPPSGYSVLKSTWANPAQKALILQDLTMPDSPVITPGDAWKIFQPIFGRVGCLLNDSDLCTNYYERAFRFLVESDHLCHVELRTTWYTTGETNPNSKESCILHALAKVNGSTAPPPLTMKAIWSDSRHNTPADKVKENMESVRDTTIANPQGVLVGYDLVGEEDSGNPSRDYVQQVLETAREVNNRQYPRLFFHDGETNLPPSHSADSEDDKIPESVGYNDNLVDAYLLNTVVLPHNIKPGRVGHAVSLFKSPLLIQKYKEAGIAVEMCPVSNQLLLYSSVREHPGQMYLEDGLACSLSPDDPAIFQYQGNTYDFFMACVAWNLSLKDMKILAYNSLIYSALEGEELSARLKLWKGAWANFITALNSN
ncbi:Adenosine deaminase CECR1 [Pelomyxa schiedti]|nr:Adenosine deaminase CECR1 [Pelomyxa schiedti]